MADLDPKLISDFNSALKTTLGTLTKFAGGAIGTGLSGLASTTGAVAKGFGQLYNGSLDLSNALHDGQDALQGFGKIGRMASAALGTLGETVINAQKMVQQNLDFGDLRLDFLQLNTQAREMGLTQEQYTRLMRNAASQIGGFGGTVSTNLGLLAKTGKELIESDAGHRLRELGVSTDELDSVMLNLAADNSNINMRNVSDQKKLALAAADLEDNMTQVSALYGISKRQMMDRQAAEKQDYHYALLKLQKSPAEMAGYEKLNQSLMPLGPQFQELVGIFGTGGTRTKEEMDKLIAATGGNQHLQQEFKDAMALQNQGRSQEAQAKMMQFKNDLANYARTNQYGEFVKNATGNMGALVKQYLVAGQDGIATQLGMIKGAAAAGKQVVDYENELANNVKAMADKTAQAQQTVGAQMITAASKADIALQTASAGFSKAIQGVANQSDFLKQQVVGINSSLDGFNKKYGDAESMQEEMIKKTQNFINFLTNKGTAPDTYAKGTRSPYSVVPHATGGETKPGAAHLVGEAGPEVYVPDTNGIVFNQKDLANLPNAVKNTVTSVNSMTMRQLESIFKGNNDAILEASKYHTDPKAYLQTELLTDIKKSIGAAGDDIKKITPDKMKDFLANSVKTFGQADIKAATDQQIATGNVSSNSLLMARDEIIKRTQVLKEPPKKEETKKEETKKEEPKKAGETTAPATAPTTPEKDSQSMKDIHEELKQLNTRMQTLIDYTDKEVRAIKGLSNNKLA